MIDIEALVWHDGILESVGLTPGRKQDERDLILIVALHDSDSVKDRHRIELRFKDLVRVSISCDLIELEDNRNAGNISNGYVKVAESGERTLRLYLVDGYIEVVHGSVVMLRQSREHD